LRFLEDICRNERLVNAGKRLSASFDLHETDIERVLEDRHEAVYGDRSALPVSQPPTEHLFCEVGQRKSSGAVKAEIFLYERCSDWIGSLLHSLAMIQIPDRRAEWIEALLQPAVDPFFHFLAEVPAVMGCNNGLNVC